MRLLLDIGQEAGATLVEFALSAMLFFIFIFGIIEFGLAVWQYNTVATLSQEGARWASVRGASGSESATDADVEAFVAERAGQLGISVNVTSSDPSALQAGATVTVQVETDFELLTGFFPY